MRHQISSSSYRLLFSFVWQFNTLQHSSLAYSRLAHAYLPSASLVEDIDQFQLVGGKSEGEGSLKSILQGILNIDKDIHRLSQSSGYYGRGRLLLVGRTIKVRIR